MLYFFAFSSLINGIIATLFGLFVYFKNRKSLINQTFGLLNLGLAIWSFSYWKWLLVDNVNDALFWSRLLNFGATLVPIFYLHWILSLLNLHQKKKNLLIGGYLITLIFLLFSFSPYYIKSVEPVLFFPYWPQAGPLYICYLIFGWLGLIGYGFYQLLKAKQNSTGVRRAQIDYVLLGSIIGFGGGATNFPLMFGLSLFPPFGNLLVVFYPFILAYAIIRYRLMDIRVVAGRTVVYVLSFGTVILFGLGLNFGNLKIGQPISMAVLGPLTLVLGIILYQVVFRLYEKLASRYFYYTFYSYQKVLTDLGKNLTKILDLDKLSSLIVNTLIETMKLDKTVILLRQPETGNYQIKKNIGFREENGISLVKDDFLTQYLEKTQKPLVYEELAMMIRDSKDNWEKSKFEDLRIKMKKIEAALCLPLLVEEKIIGLIVLGNKISGDPYSFQDIELLTALSNQSAVGLQNARLYSQVEDLSKTLAIRVEAQTKELRTAYEELKALDKAKSEFISMASHQLRTPLTAMKGYLSLLLEGKWLDNPKERKEKLQNLFISNERLIRIVNDLMNVSKIELGRMEMDWEKSQLEDLIQSVYEELKIEAEKKNLKMIFQKPKKLLPKVTIDVLKIRQVIINLIDNAIKYTQKGKIEIGLKKTNSSILFWVKDTGEGLTDKEEKDIFQGFVRGSAGLTYFVQGAGLGLYVAKKFLELHKAKIWAESPGRGKGSTFYVELPIE